MTTANNPPEKGGTKPDIAELKVGVVALADRVTQLAEALQTVNQVQQQKTADLEETMIPREEHEKIWKKEQQNLIKTRLSIRRQTYILFFISMAALAIVTYLVFHDLAVRDQQRHDSSVARCEQGNEFRRGDLSLWNEVISLSQSQKSPTPKQQATTEKFQAFLAKHDK
jgi:hypothetical protein